MSNFPHDWDLIPLEDCMEVIIDYRGKTPKKSDVGVPLVTAKIVKNGRINFEDKQEFIPFENYDSWMRRGFPKPGDVVMTMEAPLGEVAQLDNRKVALAQRLITLRGKPDLLDNTYLKYLMMSQFVQDQLQARASGTTVIGIKQSELRKVTLPLPPLPTQRRIAELLGRLDDKIELNRRINRTLEAMAQTLYRHHFVDFGPYQDGAFVESELGLIPEGWEVGRLKDIAEVNSTSIRKGTEPEEIIYVDISSVSTGHIDTLTPMPFSEAPSRARRLVRHGDMIIAAVRPNRRSFALIQHPTENLVVSTGFGVIRPVNIPYTYAYSTLSTQEFTDYLTLRATGAAYPAVNTKDFEAAPILLPDSDTLTCFHEQTEPLFEQRFVLEQQNRKLAEIRDYLLPKLLSGEIEVAKQEMKNEYDTSIC